MIKRLIIFLVSCSAILQAQQKKITLEDLWSKGTFRTERMNDLKAMQGDFYSLLNFDRLTGSSSIDKYSYKTLQKVATAVNGKDLENLNYFSSYDFNKDETKIILGTNFRQQFRHSFIGTFYSYEIATRKLQLIGKDIQQPTFSPDSEKVAYSKDNNLFIKDLVSGQTIQITKDGKKNSIINGTTDWVYEEEFAFVKAFVWSKNSDYIAFLRFDESEVPEFSMDVYGNKLYPHQEKIKYPKAGEKNSKVSLHIYSLSDKMTRKASLGNYEYIPRILWTKDDNLLSVRMLNRHQNDLKMYFVNVKNLQSNLILEEKAKSYIDITDDLTFLDDNSFLWTSEKDGYKHLYHYDKNGKPLRQITKGNWDVTAYYGYNKKNKTLYYQSTQGRNIDRVIYSIGINGKNKRLLSKNTDGTNKASFSKNLNYFINTFSNSDTPPIYTLQNSKGEMLKTIKDNSRAKQLVDSYNLGKKQFSTLSINGNDLNMYMIKPRDFDQNKKYPLLLYQYSGPGSQSVQNRWNSSNDYWHYMLAQQGYIIACVDGRGTGFKGRSFKTVTQKQLGKYEVEDQIAVAKKLGQLPYIDQSRIGIWGWSYGGFMSANCILKGNDVFKMAIAVAPVTSWRFYDSIYTERYMQTPEENPSGYDDNSPLSYPQLLKGKFLLIHGTGDDNVHVQNSMRMIEALIQANKQFDWKLYPDNNHGIYGGNTRLHLFTTMTNFIKNNL